MAIDGTNILESDLGIDVQNEILDRYDSGQSADEIKSYLKNGLQNISSSLDLEIYISTACLTLWEIGLLDDSRDRSETAEKLSWKTELIELGLK